MWVDLSSPLHLSLRDLHNMPSQSSVVTLECAGNSRFSMDPPVPGEQWRLGAVSTAEWTIQNMQDADGHFYYRDLGWRKVTTPMLHWGQATMFKALAHLLFRLGSEGAPSSLGRR